MDNSQTYGTLGLGEIGTENHNLHMLEQDNHGHNGQMLSNSNTKAELLLLTQLGETEGQAGLLVE